RRPANARFHERADPSRHWRCVPLSAAGATGHETAPRSARLPEAGKAGFRRGAGERRRVAAPASWLTGFPAESAWVSLLARRFIWAFVAIIMIEYQISYPILNNRVNQKRNNSY